MGVCGSVDLGHMGKQKVTEKIHEKVKEETLNLTKVISIIYLKRSSRCTKECCQGEGNLEFNSDESISHVMKLS